MSRENNGIMRVERTEPLPADFYQQFPSHAVPVEVAVAELAVVTAGAAAVAAAAVALAYQVLKRV